MKFLISCLLLRRGNLILLSCPKTERIWLPSHNKPLLTLRFSGLIPMTNALSDSLSLWLPASAVNLAIEINSLSRFSKRTTAWSVIANSVTRLTIATWFQVFFISCYGFFSTFPHSTNTLSVSGYI